MEFRGGEISFLIRYRRVLLAASFFYRKSISTARPQEAGIDFNISQF
jgi:hypothetical protein